MTVIATRDGILASDSQLTGGEGSYLTDCRKIKKVKGWLIGASGDFGPSELFMNKFDPSIIEEKRIVPWGSKDETMCAIIVSPKGKVYYMETNGTFIHVPNGRIAIGCGELCAMGAMEVGASAVDACKAAIKHVEGCGGRIRVLRISKSAKGSR